jgi:hypothetical protein
MSVGAFPLLSPALPVQKPSELMMHVMCAWMCMWHVSMHACAACYVCVCSCMCMAASHVWSHVHMGPCTSPTMVCMNSSACGCRCACAWHACIHPSIHPHAACTAISMRMHIMCEGHRMHAMHAHVRGFACMRMASSICNCMRMSVYIHMHTCTHPLPEEGIVV